MGLGSIFKRRPRPVLAAAADADAWCGVKQEQINTVILLTRAEHLSVVTWKTFCCSITLPIICIQLVIILADVTVPVTVKVIVRVKTVIMWAHWPTIVSQVRYLLPSRMSLIYAIVFTSAHNTSNDHEFSQSVICTYTIYYAILFIDPRIILDTIKPIP